MALQWLRIFQVRSESGFLTDDEILERSRAIASLRQQLEIEAVAAAAAAASDSSNSCLKSSQPILTRDGSKVFWLFNGLSYLIFAE